MVQQNSDRIELVVGTKKFPRHSYSMKLFTMADVH